MMAFEKRAFDEVTSLDPGLKVSQLRQGPKYKVHVQGVAVSTRSVAEDQNRGGKSSLKTFSVRELPRPTFERSVATFFLCPTFLGNSESKKRRAVAMEVFLADIE